MTEPGVGTNRYAYANNDPVNKFDPNGNFFGAFLAGFLSSALAGTELGPVLATVSQVMRVVNTIQTVSALANGADPGDVIKDYAISTAASYLGGQLGGAVFGGVTENAALSSGNDGEWLNEVSQASLNFEEAVPAKEATGSIRPLARGVFSKGGIYGTVAGEALKAIKGIDPNSVYYHYTTPENATKIIRSGVIKAIRGRAYVTQLVLSPKMAEQVLFIGNEKYVGHGDAIVSMSLSRDFIANLVPDPSVPGGFYARHSIRHGRGANFLGAIPNIFRD